MEEFFARKRVSIYLVLVCWAFAVAMMHPSFATMVAGSFLLVGLFLLRLFAHFEGQYAMKMVLLTHPGVAPKHTLIWKEAAIVLALSVGGVFILWFVVKHIPWMWMN